MKSVTICGSRRFTKEIRKFANGLKKAGVTVFEPYLHSGSEEWKKMSTGYRKFVAMGLTHDHFYKIKMADIIFVYNKDGYSGVSTTLEIGYAIALGKPIYAFSDSDEELCRNILFRGYFSKPSELIEKLK